MKTLGIDRIIRARKNGYKPTHVFVDVSLSPDHQWAARATINGPAGEVVSLWDVPSARTMESAHVFVSPVDSVRIMDWSWAVGLSVTIVGDDSARIDAAYERAMMAQASRAVAMHPFGPIRCSEGWTA